MPTVNGKNVEFRLRFPAREYVDLGKGVGDLVDEDGVLDWRKAGSFLARFITSWEFEGDPTDIESYGDLDFFRELTPLIRDVTNYVKSLTADLGEAESEST